MDFTFVQHAIVTVAAIGAAWVVIRRVLGVVKSSGGGAPKCSSCPAVRPQDQQLTSEAKPLTLVRR
ncbi:MAG TPA: hypothetical protein VIX63_11855 [Vicinamibacterales bacterium]